MDDHGQSVLCFIRKGKNGESILIACNLTPNIREAYRVGVPCAGAWREIFNSDSARYGGSDCVAVGPVVANEELAHGQNFSIEIRLAPLAIAYWKV